jgi:ABC-2 type transport system permease protein
MNRTMLQVFFQLLKRDLMIFKREYWSKLFDMAIVFANNVLIFGYFMSGEGLSANYGPFLLIAAIGSFGLIEIVGKVGLFLNDMEGERAISQILIMPIRSEWVFIYMALFWSISSMILAVLLFPIGKLLLWTRFDLTAISYVKLIPIFLTGNLFFGSFALWLSSVIPGMSSLNTLWLRYIVPLWMFGTYFFSWETAYQLNPVIGAILLINPIVYVIEGMRAAALGQAGYLPYWISLLALWGFIFACTAHAIKRLKKILDCV